MNSFVFYDLEYTSWRGAQERQWSGPGEHREIVQIAALKVNQETFEPVSEPFDMLVKPVINPLLSNYFTNLTSITQALIEEHGVPFYQAFKKFRHYCADNPILSYGRDHDVINENIDLYNLHQKCLSFTGQDIRPWFINVTQDTDLPNSGALATYLGIEASIDHKFSNVSPRNHEHNALYDVLSVITAARYLIRDKNMSPFA